MMRLRRPGRWNQAQLAGHHLPVSLALFLAGIVHVLGQGIGYVSVLEAAVLIGMGSFVVLILGTSRMLLTGMGRRSVPLQGPLALLPTGLVLVGTLGTYTGLAWGVGAARWLVPMWSLGLLVHLGVVLAAVVQDEPEGASLGLPGRLMVAGTLGYALSSSVAVPAAAWGLTSWPVALHLLLPGFVIVAILAVLLAALPRFTGSHPPGPWSWALVLTALPGPAFLAYTLHGLRELLPAAALLEGLGLAVVATGLLTMLVARRRRLSHGLYATASLALFLTLALGVTIAHGREVGRLAPVHGLLGLVGFVGGIVLAASVDLYAPALRPGLGPIQRHVQAVTLLHGLGVVFLGAGILAGPAWQQASLWCMAGAVGVHLAGAVARSWRVARPLRVQGLDG